MIFYSIVHIYNNVCVYYFILVEYQYSIKLSLKMFKKASIAFMAILNVVKCDIYIHSYDRTDQQKPIEIFKYKLVGIGPEIPVYGIQV